MCGPSKAVFTHKPHYSKSTFSKTLHHFMQKIWFFFIGDISRHSCLERISITYNTIRHFTLYYILRGDLSICWISGCDTMHMWFITRTTWSNDRLKEALKAEKQPIYARRNTTGGLESRIWVKSCFQDCPWSLQYDEKDKTFSHGYLWRPKE